MDKVQIYERNLRQTINRIVGIVGPETWVSHSVTDEPYEEFKISALNLRDAYYNFLDTVLHYYTCKGREEENDPNHPLRIFWRQHCKIEKGYLFNEELYWVYGRLLISRKPITKPELSDDPEPHCVIMNQ